MSSHRCIKSPSSRLQTNDQRDVFTNTTGAAATESSATASAVETGNLDEDARTLELLRMICGLDISALSARHVGRHRAEHYATLAGRTHAGHPPARSRSVNLYDSKNLPAVLRLRTADLLALFELYYELRKQFRQRIAKSFLPTCSSPMRIAAQYRKHDAGGSKMSVCAHEAY